jgi:hypothetical protein
MAFVASGIPMSIELQWRLFDDVEDAYREWCNASAAVELAYRHWLIAPAAAARIPYAEYVAALDGEEDAAERYEQSLLKYFAGRARARFVANWMGGEA